MACIWGVHNKAQLFVTVVIIPPPMFVGGVIQQPPGHQLKVLQALVDTGATSTAISADAATNAGLSPLGKMQVFGVAGGAYHNYYAFHVGFPLGVHAPGTMRIDVFHHLIQGAELAIGQSGFDVLLGMDILGQGSLAVEGSGTFSFSF